MKPAATLANFAWWVSGRGAAARQVRALADPRATQAALLAKYLARNADTAFGKQHGFADITSGEQYRARVPLCDYDDFAPWIDRIAAGEAQVLTADRVRLFEPSSGSTRAAKWIPYTATLQAELRVAVAFWIDDLFARDPGLVGGPAYWSISPCTPPSDTKESVVQIGFDEDAAYLGGAAERFVRRALAVPGDLRRVTDVEAFRHLTLLWLLRTPELRVVSVWHPSFLTLLLAPLAARWDALLADVRHGYRHAATGLRVPAAPRRARFLASLPAPDPRRIWPRLRLISCWGDGHAALHVDEVAATFPGVTIQPKGLFATEGVVTIPHRGTHPLVTCAHYFEFLNETDDVLLAHELVEGAEYSVVLTTGGGLYRYRLRDRVRVTGFADRTPCLRFLGKEDRVSDLYGEKLSEGFVTGVLDRVLHGVYDGGELRPRFAMLAPERDGARHGYVLYLELPPDAPAALGATVHAGLDAALRENPHYDHCARLGQLAPARVQCTGEGAATRYVQRLATEGCRLGSVKPAALSPLSDWAAVLCGTEGRAPRPPHAQRA